MNDEEVLDKMKVCVENIVKEKMRENLNNTSVNDKKTVTKSIIAELDKVIQNETNKD